MDPDRLWTDHERPGLVMYVDKKSIWPFFRLQQSANRLSKSFVVTRHDEHRDGFPVIVSRPDDQVPKHSRERRPGRADSRPYEPIPECEGDYVRSRAVNWTFFDRNDAIGSGFIVPHDQPAAAGSRAENECHLLPEGAGAVGIEIDGNEQRRGDDAAGLSHCLRQTFQQGSFFRGELVCIGEMLQAASTADPEVTTSHIPF
jgi:hypothetical protein